MANVYQQNYIDGPNYGYVRYSITPDFGEPVYPGDIVTVSGQVYSREFRIRSMAFSLGLDPNGSIFRSIVNISIAKNKVGNFTITFEAPEVKAFSGRGCMLYARFDTYDMPNAIWDDGGYVFNGIEECRMNYLKYKILPNVIEMDFERADEGGEWSNEGLYFRCRILKATINDSANANDITVATIKSIGSDGSEDEATLTIEQIEAALTEEGYTELTAQIFKDASTIGATYTLTLTLGDAYEQIVYNDIVPRAFANMHLSGASTGGVAFGMFSTAKEDEPKLESMYPAYFYAGFGDETIKMLGNVLYPVGAIFMCSDDVSPIEIYGGQWEQIKDKFLLAAGDSYFAGDTGGSAQTAIPAHNHISPVARNGNLIGLTSSNVYEWSGNVGNIHYVQSASGGGYSGISRYSTGDAGAYTVNTIPPYYVVNVWRRTELYDVESNVAVAKAIKNYRRLSHEQLEDK